MKSGGFARKWDIGDKEEGEAEDDSKFSRQWEFDKKLLAIAVF